MSSTPFHKFIELVQFDSTIRSLHKQVVSLEQLLTDFIAQLEKKRLGLEKSQDWHHELVKQRDRLDLELASLSHEKNTKERRLAAAASPREYGSLQNELKTCEERTQITEESLVDLWDQIEQNAQLLEIANQQYKNESKELLADQAVAKSQLLATEQKLTELIGSRATKLVAIPVEWIENYTAMLDRVDNPVVQAVGNSCSGCFYQIPVPLLAELSRHVFVSCPSCHRLLYDL
jgi:predicted  nucleic acid-binding Zn-ribbon protein